MKNLKYSHRITPFPLLFLLLMFTSPGQCDQCDHEEVAHYDQAQQCLPPLLLNADLVNGVWVGVLPHEPNPTNRSLEIITFDFTEHFQNTSFASRCVQPPEGDQHCEPCLMNIHRPGWLVDSRAVNKLVDCDLSVGYSEWMIVAFRLKAYWAAIFYDFGVNHWLLRSSIKKFTWLGQPLSAEDERAIHRGLVCAGQKMDDDL